MANHAKTAQAASGPTPHAVLENRVEQLVNDGKYSAATNLLIEELAALPEGQPNRARRNLLAVQAVNICKVAAPSDGCTAIRTGLELADAYLEDFVVAYGEGSVRSDEFVGMTELRGRLANLDVAHHCADAEPNLPPPQEPPPEEPPPEAQTRPSALPRLFINLGIGTGIGLARGVADLTYKQFTPADDKFIYGPSEFACSVARWGAADGPLPEASSLQNALIILPPEQYSPYDIMTVVGGYQPRLCAEHHPVKTGLASAPLHIAPEVGVRVARALVISGFARLQLITGSQVFREDPSLGALASYNQTVISPHPEGVRSKPAFTMAGGLKLKYFLGQEGRKLRFFVGGAFGLGIARLRTPLSFTNDRNGNSVPDDQERAYDADATHACLPVWPYGGPSCGSDGSVALARQVAASADGTQRVDTVRIGGGFVGGIVGFNYQVARHFALFAELDATLWFPRTTSVLVDVTLGPVLTF